MHVPDSSLEIAFNIVVSAWLAIFSYLFNRPFSGHRLTIGHFSPSAACDIHYQATVGHKTYSFTFTASSLTWRLHLPRRTDPRWLTFTFNAVYYTSTTADISTAQIDTVLWFFPVLYKQTAGSWANITMDELCIKVFKSSETPHWIQTLRKNLVGTILAGEILRADVFRTTFRFSGMTERPEDKPLDYSSARVALQTEEPGGEGESEDDSDEKTDEDEDEDTNEETGRDGDVSEQESGILTKPLRASDDDELRFNAIVRQLHINNHEGHIYSFGSIDSQIRRNWCDNSGSFAMVAEECRWVRVRFPFELVSPRNWWMQLFSSIFHFPIDLVRTFNYPVSSANLYVTRLDVTFDTFRLRDAELLKQGFSLIREKSITGGIDWSDVFLDALTHAVAPR